jgi:DNA damage-inducible protein 1
MLYIKASINKVPIQAFVDSGAQTTVMSQGLAERCNLMRLVDKRAAGIAVGVGTCKIIGKIYAAEMEI